MRKRRRMLGNIMKEGKKKKRYEKTGELKNKRK